MWVADKPVGMSLVGLINPLEGRNKIKMYFTGLYRLYLSSVFKHNCFEYSTLKGKVQWLLNIHLLAKFIVEQKAGVLVVVLILSYIPTIGLIVRKKLPVAKMDVKINSLFYI
ncbi:hypothetical protein [Psychrobacter namhaensis]|jgi:hypothetical protein|uniref:hypothetical protein n=1 Tax=Psychrobacter namhaensis TaxID=292734 RepID=UPI0018DF97AA|nr:hypothetical protein [Psychrobacter namhaensis]